MRGHRELFEGNTVVQTADVDEAHEAVTRIYLPHRFDPLEQPARLDMRLNVVKLGGVTAGYLRYGLAVRLATVEAANYHVNIPLVGATESRSGRKDAVLSTPSTAAVFTPDLPADIRWGADCEQLCLMISRDELERELEILMGRAVARPVEFAPAMDLTTSWGRSWLDAVDLLTRDCSRRESLVARHPLAARHLEHFLIDGLLMAQPHNYSDVLMAPCPPAQPRSIRRAIELMEGKPEYPWTAVELAHTVAVSVRSLQYGFRRSVGMPPMTYLREIRLARVHRELSSAAADTTTVSEVAGQWGFVHLGRFATAYHRKFGRFPSQTLRARPDPNTR